MIRKSFNDSWKFWIKNGAERFLVTLPHDAMIRQPRDPQSPSGSAQGFFPGGEYVYEKSFRAPEDFEKKHVVFQFEGVYKNAKVTLNGRKGRTSSGWSAVTLNSRRAAGIPERGSTALSGCGLAKRNI